MRGLWRIILCRMPARYAVSLRGGLARLNGFRRYPPCWPRGCRACPRDRSYPVAPPPPVAIRNPFSACSSHTLSRSFPAVFGADLLTGEARRRRKIALRRPLLSGPPDLGVLVRNSKTQVKGR